MAPRPRLAVVKFASCDGCQLSLLDLEDDLLALGRAVELVYFREATSRESAGPFDLALVDGSISSPADLERLGWIRGAARRVVAIGACAVSGGIQGLRNFAEAGKLLRMVYPEPDRIALRPESTPASRHVSVDFELTGCPVNKRQLFEVIAAFLGGRRPEVHGFSVCVECKARRQVCVLVAQGTPCLGPVTHAGCGALCPSFHRGCYGCFGPMETPNTDSLSNALRGLGVTGEDLVHAFRSFHADAPAFRRAGDEAERGP